MADAANMIFTTHDSYDTLLRWEREALVRRYARWWQQPIRWACLLRIAFWRPVIHRKIARLNGRSP